METEFHIRQALAEAYRLPSMQDWLRALGLRLHDDRNAIYIDAGESNVFTDPIMLRAGQAWTWSIDELSYSI